MKRGEIINVLMSPNHGYPTYPQRFVTVGMLGIEGDAHSGPLRESFTKPGTMKENDRPISLVAWEVMQTANQELKINMKPGDFNEQLLVKGLGDLGWVAIGSIVSFPNTEVVLEVVDYAYPCTKLATHNENPTLINFLVDNDRWNSQDKPYSKRGILAKVKSPGVLQSGLPVVVVNP